MEYFFIPETNYLMVPENDNVEEFLKNIEQLKKLSAKISKNVLFTRFVNCMQTDDGVILIVENFGPLLMSDDQALEKLINLSSKERLPFWSKLFRDLNALTEA